MYPLATCTTTRSLPTFAHRAKMLGSSHLYAIQLRRLFRSICTWCVISGNSFHSRMRLRQSRTEFEERWSDMWRYLESSHFSGHIRAFQEAFGEDRVLVLISEELATDPVSVMRSVWRFLEVDDSFGITKSEARTIRRS